MKRRAFGQEHEYLLTQTPELSEHSYLTRLFLSTLPYAMPYQDVLKKFPKEIRGDFALVRDGYSDGYSGRSEIDEMLVNQARAYFDFPNPEYATPENDDVFNLIACEKAGERLFAEALVQLRRRELEFRNKIGAAPPNGKAFRLFKNNRAYGASKNDTTHATAGALVGESAAYTTKFSTNGTHDNYQISDKATTMRLHHFFIPHLIAQTLFCGGGCIEYDERLRAFYFSRSQRFPWIKFGIGTGTRGARHFLVFRNTENFAPTGYRRMQVISGDANLFEPALLIKYATSAALLEMLEDDEFFNSVLLPDLEKRFHWTVQDEALASVAHAASRHPLDHPLPTHGAVWTLRSMATYFAEMRQRYAETVGFENDRLAGLALEQKLLAELDQHRNMDESVILARYCDQAFMKQAVERDMRRFGYDYNSKPDQKIELPTASGRAIMLSVPYRLRHLEAICHEIDPDGSMFERAQQKGLAHRVILDDTILHMMKEPPSTTRANRRKKIIEHIGPERYAGNNWVSVFARDPKQGWTFEDPLSPDITKEDAALVLSNIPCDIDSGLVTSSGSDI